MACQEFILIHAESIDKTGEESVFPTFMNAIISTEGFLTYMSIRDIFRKIHIVLGKYLCFATTNSINHVIISRKFSEISPVKLNVSLLL
jgi:hypothetical protein